jgi:hypothetical protein
VGERRIYSLLYKKERSGLAWFRTGILKLRWTINGLEKGRYFLCNEEKGGEHILTKREG